MYVHKEMTLRFLYVRNNIPYEHRKESSFRKEIYKLYMLSDIMCNIPKVFFLLFLPCCIMEFTKLVEGISQSQKVAWECLRQGSELNAFYVSSNKIHLNFSKPLALVHISREKQHSPGLFLWNPEVKQRSFIRFVVRTA